MTRKCPEAARIVGNREWKEGAELREGLSRVARWLL